MGRGLPFSGVESGGGLLEPLPVGAGRRLRCRRDRRVRKPNRGKTKHGRTQEKNVQVEAWNAQGPRRGASCHADPVLEVQDTDRASHHLPRVRVLPGQACRRR